MLATTPIARTTPAVVRGGGGTKYDDDANDDDDVGGGGNGKGVIEYPSSPPPPPPHPATATAAPPSRRGGGSPAAWWHGLGLFGESYLLFSVGTLRPLWSKMYPNDSCKLLILRTSSSSYSPSCDDVYDSIALHAILGVVTGMIVV